MNNVYHSMYILFLITTPAYAGALFGCFCGNEVEEITTTIRIETPKPQHHVQLPFTIQSPKYQTLQVPTAVRPHSTTTSDMQHIRSTIIASSRGSASIASNPILVPTTPVLQESLALSRCAASISPKTVLLAPPPSPQRLSLPSTPITPVYTPGNSFEASSGFVGLSPLASDSSPSSPESPLLVNDESPKIQDETPSFEAGRIITYPPEIREQHNQQRYYRAKALVEAFKRDLPIIHDKQQKMWRINTDIQDARTSFATTITEYCATHHIDDFPCILIYRDAHTGKTEKLALREGLYADLRALGIEAYGRTLTEYEVNAVCNSIKIPEELIFKDFFHELHYEHSGIKQMLVLRKERLATLQQLMPKQLSLSKERAEKIIHAIQVKFDCPGRSLRQSMKDKATSEAREKFEQAETLDTLSLTESCHILDPRFKPLEPAEHRRSLH